MGEKGSFDGTPSLARCRDTAKSAMPPFTDGVIMGLLPAAAVVAAAAAAAAGGGFLFWWIFYFSLIFRPFFL